jgi:hypothetical protein
MGWEGEAGAVDTVRAAYGVTDPQEPDRSVRGREAADARSFAGWSGGGWGGPMRRAPGAKLRTGWL